MQAFPDKCPDWQDNQTAGGDPNLGHGKGLGINKKTLGWNAAGAVFAYGFGTLATLGYKYVGQDQLIGGTWPDNEPAVSCMDWQSGQVNAKYWVTNLLARTVGTKVPTPLSAPFPAAAPHVLSPPANASSCHPPIPSYAPARHRRPPCPLTPPPPQESKAILNSTISDASAGYALPYAKLGNDRGVLLVNKQGSAQYFVIGGVSGGLGSVVDGTGNDDEPGFAPPVVKPVGKDGRISLGPYGVAVVTNLQC